MEGSNSVNSSRSGNSMSSGHMSGNGVVVQGGGWFIDSFNGNIKEQYHFIEKLASGGFGVVYLAEHRKTSKYGHPVKEFLRLSSLIITLM